MSNDQQQLTLFKSTHSSITYIFRNGKPAHFVQGKYATAMLSEIEELQQEIAAGIPGIYIDANETTTDSTLLNDPLEYVRRAAAAQAVEDYKAQLAAQGVFPNDTGGVVIGPDSVQTVGDVTEVAATLNAAQVSVLGGIGNTANSAATSAESVSSGNKISINLKK